MRGEKQFPRANEMFSFAFLAIDQQVFRNADLQLGQFGAPLFRFDAVLSMQMRIANSVCYHYC
jgi:hypothetical protein